MCDAYLGKLLDYFDEHDFWKDTSIILTTDHGFLLAEHEWWAKSRMPFYNEVSHIPLLFYHPNHAHRGGERRSALTQNIDVMPTLLQMHGAAVPEHVEGRSLIDVLSSGSNSREALIFGRFGGSVNATDGRYTYFLYPGNMDEQELFEYTLMPTHQRAPFSIDEFEGAELCKGFAFSRGMPLLKLPARRGTGQGANLEDTETAMYDLDSDPG